MTLELGISFGGLVIAAFGLAIALAAWRASGRSADAAQRSAEAAEGSLDIQRREAGAAEKTRQRNQKAALVPLYWESRGGQQHRGLVIRNSGPAVARGITAYERTRGGQVRKWVWPALAAGETIGLIENEQPTSDEELNRFGEPTDDGAYAHARLEWTNADDSTDELDWRPIDKR